MHLFGISFVLNWTHMPNFSNVWLKGLKLLKLLDGPKVTILTCRKCDFLRAKNQKYQVRTIKNWLRTIILHLDIEIHQERCSSTALSILYISDFARVAWRHNFIMADNRIKIIWRRKIFVGKIAWVANILVYTEVHSYLQPISLITLVHKAITKDSTLLLLPF